MTLIAGMDGCRSGWVVVQERRRGDLEWRIVPRLRDVVYADPAPTVIAIDVPIGLPDTGSRDCDILARKLLGAGRGSSVFPAPLRSVVNARTHAEASRARRNLEGKGMSIQAWAIIPKIREVDDLLRGNPGLTETVCEVHPELSFYHLANGRAMEHSKKRKAGREERMAWLTRDFGDAPMGVVGALRQQGAEPDDTLDAFAALWTARRILDGTAVVLPGGSVRDRFNLPMRMLA